MFKIWIYSENPIKGDLKAVQGLLWSQKLICNQFFVL